MIGRTSIWAHALVGVVIAISTGLVLVGWIGSPIRPEKIDQLQVTVMPAGEDGVRIREVIDQDFGTAHRHGPELLLELDFGTPLNITAESDDAPDDVSTAFVDGRYRVRIGDPDVEVTGQHRYIVEYTNPDARLSTNHLGLDAVGDTSEIPIDDVDVIVTGMTLENLECNAGGRSGDGGCEFSDGGVGYRTHVDHLDDHEGITIGGDVVNRSSPVLPDLPRRPDRKTRNTVPWAIGTVVSGSTVAALVFLWARRRGANEIAGGGGAADAAYLGPTQGLPTQMVSDAELASMSTIEFAPPPGIEPWQGAIALRERVDTLAATAWFSGAAAHDWLEIESSGSGETTALRPGPARSQADRFSAEILDDLFRGRSEIKLGTYDSHFASAWRGVTESMVLWAQTSAWWRSRPPQASADTGVKAGGCLRSVGLVLIGFITFPLLAGAGAIIGGISAARIAGPVPWMAGVVLVGLLLPAGMARLAYGALLPSRTAAGSAAALRTESFRRFLVESEAQHVQWAWDNGLMRQYSAWAVALGAADAWRKAMEASGIPRAEIDNSQILLNGAMASSFVSTSTAPSTSSSSSSGFSGGGFSGGSVGGGGGGGGHGSW